MSESDIGNYYNTNNSNSKMKVDGKSLLLALGVGIILMLIIFLIYKFTERYLNNDDKNENQNKYCLICKRPIEYCICGNAENIFKKKSIEEDICDKSMVDDEYCPPIEKKTTSPPLKVDDELCCEEREKLEEKPEPEAKDCEVFNISNNIFTYEDAPAVCAAYGSKLATYDDLKRAYDKGANWCNYGWTDGQLALYPTQEEAWKKLQKGPKKNRNNCGRPGINGGYFENPDLKFGVNCYGPKPKPKDSDQGSLGCPYTYVSREHAEFNDKVKKYTTEIEDHRVLPFNNSEWSQ